MNSYDQDATALYWAYIAPETFPGTGTLFIYSDEEHSNLVAKGTITNPPKSFNDLTFTSSYGLSGSVRVACDAVDDSDDNNTLRFNEAGTLVESGDDFNNLSRWQIFGATKYNSDNYKWYWSYEAPVSFPGTGRVFLYKDAAKEELVAIAQGIIPTGLPTEIVFSEENDSTIDGSVKLSRDAATDDDELNKIVWPIGSNWEVVSGDWAVEWSGSRKDYDLVTMTEGATIKCTKLKPAYPNLATIRVKFALEEEDEYRIISYGVETGSQIDVKVKAITGGQAEVEVSQGGSVLETANVSFTLGGVTLLICILDTEVTVNVGSQPVGPVEITRPTGSQVAFGSGAINNHPSLSNKAWFDDLTLYRHGSELTPTEYGDAHDVMSGWSFNLSAYDFETTRLYWAYEAPAVFPGVGTVSIYSDSEHENLLAHGSGEIPHETGSVTVLLEGESGLMGYVRIKHDAATDADAENSLTWGKCQECVIGGGGPCAPCDGLVGPRSIQISVQGFGATIEDPQDGPWAGWIFGLQCNGCGMLNGPLLLSYNPAPVGSWCQYYACKTVNCGMEYNNEDHQVCFRLYLYLDPETLINYAVLQIDGSMSHIACRVAVTEPGEALDCSSSGHLQGVSFNGPWYAVTAPDECINACDVLVSGWGVCCIKAAEAWSPTNQCDWVCNTEEDPEICTSGGPLMVTIDQVND